MERLSDFRSSLRVQVAFWLGLGLALAVASLLFVPIDSTPYTVVSGVSGIVLVAGFLLLVLVTAVQTAHEGLATAIRRSTVAGGAFVAPPTVVMGIVTYLNWQRLRETFAMATDPWIDRILQSVQPEPLGVTDIIVEVIVLFVMLLMVTVLLSTVSWALTRALSKVADRPPDR